MPDSANVKATDAIDAVRAQLGAFVKQAGDGLAEVGAEVRRTLDWIEHDRPRYWKERTRRAWDGVTQAKADLNRCLMYHSGPTERPSCTEQRAALKRAEAQLAYCQQKQERLAHWVRELHHEMHEYLGRVASLQHALEADLPEAAAALKRLTESIEAYTRGSVAVGRPAGDVSADEAPPEAPPEGGG